MCIDEYFLNFSFNNLIHRLFFIKFNYMVFKICATVSENMLIQLPCMYGFVTYMLFFVSKGVWGTIDFMAN